MVRFRYAALAATVLTAGWLAWLGYAAGWQTGEFYEGLGQAALSWRLAGLSAGCYAQAAKVHRADWLWAKYYADRPAEQLTLSKLVRARMTAARILLAAQRPSAALAFAEDAYRADYSNLAAVALLWRVRYAGGMTGEAKRELILLGLDNQAPEILAALGELFLAESDLEQARNFAERALGEAPKVAAAWLLLARAHAQGGDTQSAHQAVAKAWYWTSDQPVVRRQTADLYLQLHRDRSSLLVAGRGIDYWWQVVGYWVEAHWVFLVGLAAYLIFLFSPAIGAQFRRRGNTPPASVP